MSIQSVVDQRLNFDMADRMRRALRVSGISVKTMAEELQVSRNAVTNWINGHNTPRRRDLVGFALKTGFPVSWIENGTLNGPDGGGNSQEENSEITFVLFAGKEKLAQTVRRWKRPKMEMSLGWVMMTSLALLLQNGLNLKLSLLHLPPCLCSSSPLLCRSLLVTLRIVLTFLDIIYL